MIYQFIKCWVDGGVFGTNPSRVGCYWSCVLELPGAPVTIRKRSDRYFTNADSEYLALREALKYLVANKVPQPIVVYSDSLFVIDTFNGTKQFRNPRFKRIYHQCRQLAAQLKFVGVRFPPRPEKKPRGWPEGRRFPEDWRPRDEIVRVVGH